MKLLIALMFLTGCVTTIEKKPRVKFIDIRTYNEWGTDRMHPLSRRPIPTQREVCYNPMWADSESCREYLDRQSDF